MGPFSGPKNAPIFWAPTLFIKETLLGRGPFFGHVFGSGGSRFGGASGGHKSAAKNLEWSCFRASFRGLESVRTHRTPMLCFSESRSEVFCEHVESVTWGKENDEVSQFTVASLLGG